MLGPFKPKLYSAYVILLFFLYNSSYLFHSGNSEHPGDKFYNTTVEVLPVDHIGKADGILTNKIHEHGYPRTEDGYLIINEFKEGKC